MTKLFKSITKYIITFLLVFSILFQSLYFKPEKVEANPGAAAIAGYIMSIVGAIDMGTGGGVRGIATSLKDSLTQKVADLMGTGIYEDSNGNYIFSGDATKQIYDTLLGSDAYNAIVCSQFPISSQYEPPNTYYNPTAWELINSKILSLNDCLVIYGLTQEGQQTQRIGVYDISNVAYFELDYYATDNRVTLNCVNSSGNYFYCPYTIYTITGTGSSNYSVKTGTSNIYLSATGRDSEDIKNITALSNVSTKLSAMYNFNYNCIYSKKSIIIAQNKNYGSYFINKNTGVTVNTYYSNIPSCKSTVIENNDWDTIYNNYVQNIQNESNTYIDNGEIDIDALREEMQRQGSIIYDAVSDGVENIIEYVSVTNEWLKKIYNLLLEINNKLENGGGSSGGTVSGSTVDLTNIESYLQSLNTSISAMQTQIEYIKNNLPNDEQQLTAIYTVLSNIYQSLQNLPSGGVTDPDSDPYQPWYPKFFALPDADILDTIGQIQIIETLLAGLVPLCYVTGLGAVVNALGVQPVTPVFTIPVEMNNPIMTVDEDIEIDLSMFEDVRDYIVGGEVILFMLSLGYFTIWLLKFLLDILGKN